MNLAFEIYRPRSSRENVVALTKHHIRLSRKLVDKLGTDRVEVAYDRDSNKLRIRGTEEGGLMLNKNKIGARGIFKYFDIEGKKGNFAADYNEKEKAIFVDLNQFR
nr:hypothetical protein [Desulfallas sp. Bu1-1]